MNQCDRNPGAGAADRMAEGNRSAVDVELAAIEVQFAIAGEHLRGKGFVQFDQIEAVNANPVLLFHLAQCGHRPDPHDARVNSG